MHLLICPWKRREHIGSKYIFVQTTMCILAPGPPKAVAIVDQRCGVCKCRSACSHIAGNVKGSPLKALHIVFLSTPPSSCDHPISTMLVPLFKIPLIATAVGLHYSALKAPNPPPMTGKDRRGFFERTVMYSIPFNVFTQKVRSSLQIVCF